MARDHEHVAGPHGDVDAPAADHLAAVPPVHGDVEPMGAGAATPVRTTVELALAEGFEGDRVRVHVDDVAAAELADVTTRLQLGLADLVALDVPRAPFRLVVDVDGGPTGSAEVDPDRTPWVRAELAPDGLHLQALDQPHRFA